VENPGNIEANFDFGFFRATGAALVALAVIAGSVTLTLTFQAGLPPAPVSVASASEVIVAQ
jgi:hypothetical protein